MKKYLKILLVLVIALCFVTGCKSGKKEETKTDLKNVQIVVYSKENKSVYNEKVSTKKKYLIDVLKEQEELKIKTEDSQYGEFITSIKGLSQGDNYYWNYYIDGEYAQVGVSQYEIKNDETYTFKLEKFNKEW